MVGHSPSTKPDTARSVLAAVEVEAMGVVVEEDTVAAEAAVATKRSL